jgi:hypothetical protein
MLAGLPVGATQHGQAANRRFQDFQQKSFSKLDNDNFAARHAVPDLGYLLSNAIM